MSAAIEVGVEGIGLWAPGLPGWQASLATLQGRMEAGVDENARPAPALLAATERRRAPESVLLALEVAQQACSMAACQPGDLSNVFASAYGDLAINDYLCATLARAPEELSPTKFHNSVHNAPAGYWAIATGCMHNAIALSAGGATFGAGLFEAALLAQTEMSRVLFVAYDMAVQGPLAEVMECTLPFAVALVLAPQADSPGAAIRLSLQAGTSMELAPDAPLLQAVYRGNPIARGLPLLMALARGEKQKISVPAGPQLSLHMETSSWLK